MLNKAPPLAPPGYSTNSPQIRPGKALGLYDANGRTFRLGLRLKIPMSGGRFQPRLGARRRITCFNNGDAFEAPRDRWEVKMFSRLLPATALAAITMLSPMVAFSQSMPRAAPGITYSTRTAAAEQKRPDPQRYAKQVDAYLAADKQAPPDACGILFIGSASVVAWKTLKTDMAPAPVFARGLGASTVADQIFYFDKIVTPYKPRAIFMYATENDVVNGLTAEEVLGDLKKFMDLKTKTLGATPVYILAAKASPARLNTAAEQNRANQLEQKYATTRKDLVFIDVATGMWEDGKVLGQLKPIYIPDGIHMTPEGYVMWTKLVKPYVDKEAARKITCL